MRVGIVSMMREPGALLEPWVHYHKRLGFSDFIVLFDDPEDEGLAAADGHSGLHGVPVDDGVRKQWRQLRHWQECGEHTDSTVGARQMLNIEYGFNLARELGVDWLLHIDIDELFHLKSGDVIGHVSHLAESEKNAAAYFNYEAVPETFQVDDCFRQVTLFKKPPKLLQHQGITRAGVWPEGRRYFNFYNNGKSMVRVDSGVFPLGAHRWARERDPLRWVSFFNPAVLHYSVCGFGAFQQKYRHRGNFSNMRMNKDLRKSGAVLDLDARDAFAAGDLHKAEEIYRQRVMMDSASAGKLLQAGVLKRFDLSRNLPR